MNRADEFVEKFRKPVDMIYENINSKEMAVCVFIYARDKKDKSDDEDGSVRFTLLSKMQRFDGQVVKNILENEIEKMGMNL